MKLDPNSIPESAVPIISETPGPRPKAVTFLLLAIVLFTLRFALGTAQFLWEVISRLGEMSSYSGALLAAGWRILAVAALVAATLGIVDRKQWGRWSGLLVLGLLAVAVYTLVPDTTVYQTEAQRAGGRIGRAVAPVLLLGWWAYAFAFSAKAKRYFD